MADNSQQQNILLKVQVDGQKDVQSAKQDVDKLNQAAAQGGKVDMTSPVRTLRQELRAALGDVQKLVNAGQTSGAAFREAAQRVAEIKDKIADTNATIAAFDPDNKFKVLGTAAGLAAKGVQGYTGAMAFLGDTSKDTQETLLKLHGIMAFADSLNAIADLRDTWRNLNAVVVQTAGSIGDFIGGVFSKLTGLFTTNTSAAEAQTVAIEAQATANEANTVATEASGAATVAQGEAAVATAGMMGAATVATEGATLASTLLGVALKALGIGLIVSAIALLVDKWDAITGAVKGALDPLDKSGKKFDEIKAKAFGIGNAILQFVIGPYKAIYHTLVSLFNGDGISKGLEKAQNDLKTALDFSGNYQKEVDAKNAEYKKDADAKALNNTIAAQERQLKVAEAGGKKSWDLQQQINNNKLKLLKDYHKEYNKDGEQSVDDEKKLGEKIADVQNEGLVIQAKQQKEADDKRKKDAEKAANDRKRKLEEDLNEIKRQQDEASKIVAEGNASDGGTGRQSELAGVQFKYKQELDLLDKHQNDLKAKHIDYASARKNLLTAQRDEEAKINKKYDDEINDYLNKAQADSLNVFDKKAKEISDEADKMLEKAKGNADLTEKIIATRNQQLDNNSQLKSLTNTADTSKLNTEKVKANNVVTLGDTTIDDNNQIHNSQETPDQARAKIQAITVAEMAQEQADYNLKRAQAIQQDGDIQKLAVSQKEAIDAINNDNSLDDAAKQERINSVNDEYAQKIQAAETNNQTLQQLTQDHETNLTTITKENSDARKKIAMSEQQFKQQMAQQAEALISNMAQVVGQNTVAGKALAIASATINTYEAATQALENPWPLNLIAMAATITSGLLAVKNIVATKVPVAGGAGSAGASTPSTAPVINATMLSQTANGASNVVNAVQTASQAQQASQTNVRAYIVNKDLNNQQTTNDYYKNQSTY